MYLFLFLFVLINHFYRFHIITWNVSSKFPENLPVHILLGLEKKAETDTHRPDFFVIG